MNNFYQQFIDRIDAVILVLVILSGFFQKKYLAGLVLSKQQNTDGALKTLALSFIVCLAWILLKRDGKATAWADYFITYFFATSLYELILSPFKKWIQKYTGKEVSE